MRGTVAKEIHSFEKSHKTSFKVARRLWSTIMGRNDTGQHPVDTTPPRQRRRYRKLLALPKSRRFISRVAPYGISSCASNGVRRHPPYAKVSLRKMRSAWLRAAREAEQSPTNTMLQQAREHFATAIKLAGKGMARLGGMFKRGNGRGA